MKGKKFVLSLLVTVSIFACLAFVACNNTDESTHEHTYSSVWSSDGKYHWHVATCGHDVISDKAEHSGNPCTVCGYEGIPEHKHTFSDKWESDETYHWHSSTCGHNVVSGKAEHIWDGGVVTKAPTCTEKGEKTYTCTVCDKTKKEEIAASGHTFSDKWESDETYHWHPSTCGHDVVSGKTEHNGNPCAICGYESIPEHEHNLEHRAAKPVTCTENGNIEYWECSGCHKYFSDEQGETEITDKNSVIIVTEGHTWGKWETVKQATCTEDGKKERRCSACTEIEYETIPALNHNYGNWQTVKEPTCTEEGEKQRVCSLCSHKDTETIPVIAHTYDGYIKNSEYHWQKCAICQNDSEREPHNFVDGVCSVCNYDSRYSWELDFTLTGDYYTLTGMGDCTDKEIKIPESYEGKPVKAIAANAFWGQTGITSFNIPKSIESIGNNAFQNCTGLEEISIENKDIELGAGAFLGCEKITWASLPAFVVSEIAVTNLKILVVIDGELENAVLSDAKNLVSLTVPDITTTLGAVFGANTDVLESLTLTETTEIAENAFKNFTALKEINLPEGINSIGADAFLNTAYYNDSSNWVFNVLYLDSYLLKANTQITGHYPINNNTTVIADAAFNGCTGLTSIDISDNVETIGNNAFENCSGLTSVSIPDCVTSIGGDAFSGCSELTGVYITDLSAWCNIYFESANANPLYYVENLYLNNTLITELIIPENVTNIEDYVFSGYSGLTSITIPESVTSIGHSAFLDCCGLTSIALPFVGATKDGTENTHFGYIFGASSYSENISYVPKSLEKVIITGGTSIGNSAFKGCSGLTNITIPDSVTSIGSSAFSGCSGLTSITIPDSVTSIGNSAFKGCSGLTNITIPDSVTSIGSSAFSGCSGLTNITIPFVGEKVDGSGATHFGNIFGASSYSDNDDYVLAGLKEVIITGGTSIVDYAFFGCRELTSIIIPDSVTSIGSYAFSGCRGLTNVIIPNSVTSIGGSAFYDCSGLTSVTIGNSVTSIGDFAFSSCSELRSITVKKGNTKYYSIDNCIIENETKVLIVGCKNSIIPDDGSVTSIGDSAFSGCSGLKSIIIPNSVTSIGDSAFQSCSGLTSIIIPDSVTSIGDSAFQSCSGLTSIIIPNSVTSIGDSAFQSCSGLTSIIIPDSITSIGSYAFSGCRGLTNVIIPNSVTSIGDSAFSDCSGLTSVTIGNSVTSIGDSAFRWCRELTSITLPFVGATLNGTKNTHFGYIFGASSYSENISYVPKSLQQVIITGATSIGNSAFNDCIWLTSVIIGNSVMSIGSSAFEGCSGLTNIIVEEGNTKYHSKDNCIIETGTKTLILGCQNSIIPDDGSVTSIGSSAFSGCRGLTSITIPDSVTSIGSSAFSGCRGLTSITIPDSVTSIGNSAFSGCSRLTSITIPDSVTSIGNSAFSGCSGLTSITIPDSVTSIGNSAFSGCSRLTSITIPDSVTSIGNSAFSGCSGLTNITIPFVGEKVDGSGATHFGYIFGASSYIENDYYISKNLKEVIITGGTSIGDFAFYAWRGLTSIIIPDSVTSIGNSAFEHCFGLTSVAIGNSVTSIGDSAFYACVGLTNITIPDSVTSIGYCAFYGCSGLTSVIIPDSVTSIGYCAFYGCSGLTSVIIPDSVTSIGYSAFRGCSGLTSITIPDSVTSIGNYAFYGCSKLTIYCEAENKPSGWDNDWNLDDRPVIWGYKSQ